MSLATVFVLMRLMSLTSILGFRVSLLSLMNIMFLMNLIIYILIPARSRHGIVSCMVFMKMLRSSHGRSHDEFLACQCCDTRARLSELDYL